MLDLLPSQFILKRKPDDRSEAAASELKAFVKLREGRKLDESIEQAIRDRLRTTYSPRHVPDRIVQVTSIPYTLTGKKLEVPVRRILSGVPEERAANRAAMADPTALDFFIDYARTQRDYSF